MFAERFACVSATPLGADVDPEVNWTKAMSSSRRRRVGFERRRVEPFAREHERKRRDSSRAAPSKAGASAAVVITARAPARAQDAGGQLEIARQIAASIAGG